MSPKACLSDDILTFCTMKYASHTASIVLFLFCSIHATIAANDSPTPHFVLQKATEMKANAENLIGEYKNASKGKKWGRSPGHLAVYTAMFKYRDELTTLIEMSKPGASPDRLMKVVMDCEAHEKHIKELASYLILPKSLKDQIFNMRSSAKEMTSLLNTYEGRYFVWKKTFLEKRHASELAAMRRQVANLEDSQQVMAREAQKLAEEARKANEEPRVIVEERIVYPAYYPQPHCQPHHHHKKHKGKHCNKNKHKHPHHKKNTKCDSHQHSAAFTEREERINKRMRERDERIQKRMQERQRRNKLRRR